jgi:hypothetical protein
MSSPGSRSTGGFGLGLIAAGFGCVAVAGTYRFTTAEVFPAFDV